MWIFTLSIYMHFCLCKWNWCTDFIFHRTNFGNSKKLESIVNIFVFFIKISCQSKESPLPKHSHLQSKLTLSRKNIPTLIAKLGELNSCVYKGGGGGEGGKAFWNYVSLYLKDITSLRWCCASYLFGSQIPVTAGGGRFELWISCIQSSYLTQ